MDWVTERLAWFFYSLSFGDDGLWFDRCPAHFLDKRVAFGGDTPRTGGIDHAMSGELSSQTCVMDFLTVLSLMFVFFCLALSGE
jgi:hypothetical protein